VSSELSCGDAHPLKMSARRRAQEIEKGRVASALSVEESLLEESHDVGALAHECGHIEILGLEV
jgi:hypothetical protein